MAAPADYLLLSLLLLAIGVYGLASKRDAIRLLFSLEIILNAALLNLVLFTRLSPSMGVAGQVLALFVISIGACEVAVGLAIIILVYRRTGDVNVYELRKVRD
jgi:NADH:ubiquinone oxidoreductase subunit K